ncbi:MAG TPA: dihydroorotase [Rhodobiaceae bacterium]|nr:dihydroorotase [Rhodobiaceae bacterium]|tara:strand:+ start:6386 stop:7711 length:1326 start_codon:yes stop_codon:yes gene_type:complete
MTTEKYDLIISGGTIAGPAGTQEGDIGIKDERFAAMGDLAHAEAGERLDVSGLTVLPGVIDTQVHFREPGLEHKEDLQSGSLAAVMGGVTAVFEMPNTKPPTTNKEAIEDKVARGRDRMHCDFAFYVGGTHENAAQLPELERMEGICGVKVFMGSSTGNLLVPDDDGVGDILKHIKRRAAFHSEDEYRLRERRPLAETGNVLTHPVWRDEEVAFSSTRRLIKLAREANQHIHVLHVTTEEEMQMLAANRDIVSVEVTPQHLTLAAPEAYEEIGTFAQMNPPIREARHRSALWKALEQGIVDVIGSDHAPHTREEKAEAYPHSPAGMPGVQTLLPLMLDHMAEGKLSLEKLVTLTSLNAQKLFGLKEKGAIKVGNHADLTFVDLNRSETITEDWIAARCGWSPFAGRTIRGWPVGTMVRGTRVMWQGELTAPATGQPCLFDI